MTLGSAGIGRKSVIHRFLSLTVPLCFSLVRAGTFETIGKTDKVDPPSLSNELGGAFACSILLVPPCRADTSPKSVGGKRGKSSRSVPTQLRRFGTTGT
jgi:hypothetical protein